MPFSPERIDMNAVLERLDQPFENEVKWEDPSFVEAKMKEEKFLMEEEWFKIRVNTLNFMLIFVER